MNVSSKNLLEEIHAFFPAGNLDLRTLSPLKLAYLGDAVFDIIIRTLVLEHNGGAVKHLHSQASSLVNAGTQARLATAMLPVMNEEEQGAYRHGRNAKASSVAKNADIHDYRNATGLETLFGYLYLSGQTGRAVELLKHAMEELHIII